MTFSQPRCKGAVAEFHYQQRSSCDGLNMHNSPVQVAVHVQAQQMDKPLGP